MSEDEQSQAQYYSNGIRIPGTNNHDPEPIPTDFTEGDPNNRSISGGGMENEIRQIKTLLGQLSQHTLPIDFASLNKTFEYHNKPPATFSK